MTSLTIGGGTVNENQTVFYYAPTKGWDRGTFRGFGKPPPSPLHHHSGTHSGTKDPANNANGRPIIVRNKEGETFELAVRDVYIPLADTLAQKPPQDLLALPELHHSVLVHALRERHSRDVCYTFLGGLLVSLNPFQYTIPHYSMSMINDYLSKAPGPNVHDGPAGEQLLPHPWSVAHRVFFEMRSQRKNHSIIISGESGSGKTETCKIVLHYLCCLSADILGVERPPHPQQAAAMPAASVGAAPAAAASTSSKSAAAAGNTGGSSNITQLIDMVNASNPIMEAFGNAKTARNDNSSRFGKLLEVQFGSSGEIGGMKISPFLLEKSRCVTAAQDERVYHSFYQLMAGASDHLKAELKLKNARDFPMLSRGGAIQVAGVNDAKEFELTCEAFVKMGFTVEEREFVWRMVAACLHLSTVAFVAKPDPEKEKQKQQALAAANNKTPAAVDIPKSTGAARAAAKMFENKEAEAPTTTARGPGNRIVGSLPASASAAPIRSSNVGSQPKEDPADLLPAAISPASLTTVEFIAEKLLKVDVKDFTEMMTTSVMTVGRDVIPQELSRLDAGRQRDTLQKHIYSCLFFWIIEKVNAAIGKVSGDHFVASNTISVLDIFGFEDFVTGNSLEQLCINLANEALQRHYSYHVFVRDTEEIASEGVEAQMAAFADNKHCVDLIMGSRNSLFSILEDCATLDSGRGDRNLKYLEKITEKHKPDYHTAKPSASKSVMDRDASELATASDFFARARLDSDSFTVKHFASDVKYRVEAFIEKNIDSLKDNAKMVLYSSVDPLLQALMELGASQDGSTLEPAGSPVSPRSSGPSPLSPNAPAATGRRLGIAGQFRRSLQELLQTLDNTMPNWIRCIRPHPKKAPKLFDTKSVLEQLMATGVLETITQRQRNFPFRLEITGFVHRFGVICAGTQAFKRMGRGGGLHEKCAAILAGASCGTRAGAQVGKTKVFLRTENLNKLERARQERVEVLARTVGVFGFAYLSRHIRRQLQVVAAQIRIRKWYRRWKLVKKMIKLFYDELRRKKQERDEEQRQHIIAIEQKERALLATLEKTDRRPYQAQHTEGLVPLLRAATQHLVRVEPSFRDKITRLEYNERQALHVAEVQHKKEAAQRTKQRLEDEARAFERAMEELAEEVNAARQEVRCEEKEERALLHSEWAPVHDEIMKLAERIRMLNRHRDSMLQRLKEDAEREKQRIAEARERKIASEARIWQSLAGPEGVARDIQALVRLGLTDEQVEEQMRRFFLSGAPSMMIGARAGPSWSTASAAETTGAALAAASAGGVHAGVLNQLQKSQQAREAAVVSSDALRRQQREHENDEHAKSSSTSHSKPRSVTHADYAAHLRQQYELSVKSGRTTVLPSQARFEAARHAIATGAHSLGGGDNGDDSNNNSSKSALDRMKISDKAKEYARFVQALRDGTALASTFEEHRKKMAATVERGGAEEQQQHQQPQRTPPKSSFRDPAVRASYNDDDDDENEHVSPTKRVSFNKNSAAAAGFTWRRI